MFDPKLAGDLEHVLHVRDLTRPTIKQQQVLDGVFDRLGDARDFQIPEVHAAFRLLVEKTLLFVTDRLDVSHLMGSDVASYLFEPDDGQALTKEKALQRDYYNFLKASDIGRRVEVEVPEVAGGRVDVLIHFDRCRFVAEVKRELADVSSKGLQTYVGQSALYQTTDMKLGFLLVLDLTGRNDGTRGLEQSMWVEVRNVDDPAVRRHVVVAVVTGNRRPPREAAEQATRAASRTTKRR